MKLPFLGGVACAFALSLAGVAVPAPVPKAAKITPEMELARLVGKWKVTSRVQAGAEVVAGNPNAGEALLTFSKEGGFGWATSTEEMGKITRIDPTKNPKEVDYLFTAGTLKGIVQKGLYKFDDDDTYTDCCTKPGGERPTEFKSTNDNGYEIMVIKRVKKKDD